MVVNNCVGQRKVSSVPKFAGTAVKTRKLFRDSLWPEQGLSAEYKLLLHQPVLCLYTKSYSTLSLFITGSRNASAGLSQE